MLRLFFFTLFVITVAHTAKVPKPYAPIAKPIFRDIEPVRQLSKLSTFKEEQTFLREFVAQSLQARKAGFALERSGDKKASKQYLMQLRNLQKQHSKTAYLVKTALLKAIKKNHSKTYRAIVASKHSVIQTDPRLRQRTKSYTKTLEQRRIKANQRYQNTLRTPTNLEGLWYSDQLQWQFQDSRLTTVHTQPKKILTLEGKWHIKDEVFHFYIDSITHQRPEGHPHSRKQKIYRQYAVLSISDTTLHLRTEKNATLKLTKKAP